MKPGAGDHCRAMRAQVEFMSQRRIDDRDLGAGIEKKVVRTGVVEGYGHNHLIAVHEMKGYTGDIFRATRFCRKHVNHGCRENEGSEPLEICHRESSSAEWAEGTLSAWLYMVLRLFQISFCTQMMYF